MSETHDPAPSKKLGGIPVGQTPGVYHKPPASKMRSIPRPVVAKKPRAKKSKIPRVLGFLLVIAMLGGGAFFFVRQQPNLLPVIQQKVAAVQHEATAIWEKVRQKVGRKGGAPASDVVAATGPVDTTPIADPAEGWTWLFTADEWRKVGEARRECRNGILRLRGPLEKPQPVADGAIRARVLIRGGAGSASLVARSTPEGGRYRFMITPDLNSVRLLHEQGGKAEELGKYRLSKPFEIDERAVLELRIEGEQIVGLVNSTIVIEAKDKRSAGAGNWGIDAGDAWFELVEVPVPKEKVVAEAAPPAPMPAAPAAPTAPKVESETAKWLVSLEAQWKVVYERDVLAPFEKRVAALKKQYGPTLDSQLAIATQNRKLDDAAFFRGERKRVDAGEDVPATDDIIVPPALRQLRMGYRTSYAQLEKERLDRARPLHAQYDAVLAQNEAALTQRQRAEEAAEIKAQRGKISAVWLKPPTPLPAPPPPVAAASTATPPPKPAIGTTKGPATTAKLSSRQVVEKLLALGAGVFVGQKSNPAAAPSEIKSLPELVDEKSPVIRVIFRPRRADNSAITAADLEILDALNDVQELTLSAGPAVTDEVLAKLQSLRTIQQLTLDGCKATSAGYGVLATLPDLRELYLRALPSSDDVMKAVGLCRKLQHLSLGNMSLGDTTLVGLGKLSALEEIDMTTLDRITSTGFAHLAECRSLRRLTLSGFRVTSQMIETVGKCTSIETLNVSGSPLTDSEIAPLGGLHKLQSLNLTRTNVSGAGFAKWPPHTSLITLNLEGASKVDDESMKGIATAFSRVETLDFTIASSATGAGFASLGRLRKLRNLRIDGDGVTDEIAVEIAKCDTIDRLNILGARLTDPGAAALTKLPKLTALTLAKPPVTDAALKSFSKCKALRSFNLGPDPDPELEKKLKAALSGVTFR